jgi:hypothetical protein
VNQRGPAVVVTVVLEDDPARSCLVHPCSNPGRLGDLGIENEVTGGVVLVQVEIRIGTVPQVAGAAIEDHVLCPDSRRD